MVLPEAIITAVTVLAVQLGFTKIQQSRGKDGFFSITALTKNGEKVTLVKLSNPTLGSPQYDLVNLNATATTRDPDKPTYELKNDSSVDKRIFTIGIIPVDAATKTNAIIEVWLNERRLFPITASAAGMLSGTTAINVPIPPNFGLAINEKKSLQVFLWTPSAVPVSVTFAVFVANMR